MADPTVGKVPVIESMAEAWRFFFANWLQFIPACLVVAAGAGVTQMLAGPLPVEGQPQTFSLGAMAASFAIGLTVGAVFSAAVLRKAVRGEAEGPIGLGFGADEFRLVGVAVSLMLVFLPFIVLVSFVLVFIVLGRAASSSADLEAILSDPEALSAALSESLGPAGTLAFFLFMLVCVAGLAIVAARLAMVNAATIGERRMMIFQTWGWTRGNVRRVLAALLLTLLPGMIISGFISGLVSSPLVVGADNVSDLQLFATGAIAGFVGALAQIPVLALAAHLYRGLRPSDFAPK
ncbi:MAG: hypothetical protein SGJ21_03400 [Alphaproteobacteria bacterium]|nr:hypothetical protein [Alphaproteobacteria bacterium]